MSISRTHIQLGKFFVLDWYAGVLCQLPCVGLGVWVGKTSQDGRWQVVCD